VPYDVEKTRSCLLPGTNGDFGLEDPRNAFFTSVNRRENAANIGQTRGVGGRCGGSKLQLRERFLTRLR